MSILAQAPIGGITADLGGETRPLNLLQGGIERFERQHKHGIYRLFLEVSSGTALSYHCRDVVALGLVGGGMTDKQADDLMQTLRSQDIIQIQSITIELLRAAFVDMEAEKKSVVDGSSNETTPSTSTTAKAKSKTPTKQA